MTMDRTTYAREFARRKRAEKVAAANMSTLTCQAMLFRGKRCGTALRSRFVDGVTVPFCPTCDRKARGICIECDAPVDGTPRRALYCALHRRLAQAQSYARWRKENRTALKRKHRTRMKDPSVHADRLEYKRLYRKALPTKTAAEKKRYYQRNREHVLAYMAEYRARNREKRAAVERARHHGTLPPRTCLTCPTVLTGRPKRCPDCKAADRRMARERIASRTAFQKAAS